MSDVEAKTIEYTEELLRMWFDKPDNTVLNWIARKIAELEARIAELESPEDPAPDILEDLSKVSEETKEVMLKTLEQGAREASGRGC